MTQVLWLIDDPDDPSPSELLDLQLLIDVCDKAEVDVSREVRVYLADHRL